MPIFDYRCNECGYTFDILQKLGADALTECPECGQPQLKKLLSAPAFHLKGKGWRNSDDAPKKLDVRPKFAHTLDSPVAHGEHTHDGPGTDSHDKGHSHDHGHSHPKPEAPKSGVGKIAHKHVHGNSHGHSRDHGHSHEKKDPAKKKGGHSHGHGHKHDH